mmetsp:Transcript_135386/g.235447  ORF Transcript_135386/g.235447 Transcript_135386/m.235447 type:complete len:135 (+) Transcript_135386:140-544(+)
MQHKIKNSLHERFEKRHLGTPAMTAEQSELLSCSCPVVGCLTHNAEIEFKPPSDTVCLDGRKTGTVERQPMAGLPGGDFALVPLLTARTRFASKGLQDGGGEPGAMTARPGGAPGELRAQGLLVPTGTTKEPVF